MIYRFASPDWFFIILVSALLLILSLVLLSFKKKKLVSSIGIKTYQFLSQSVSIKKIYIKLVFSSLAIAFIGLSLARPQSGQQKKEVKSQGIELMILFDVSRSMLAEDVKPSRLEFAKKEIIRFLDLGGGDRIGIIAFAGSAALLSPVTTDKNALKMFIEALTIDTVSTQGTYFKGALEMASQSLKRGGVAEEEKRNSVVTQAIVIVSDGEDNEEGALDYANQLTDQGIRIFTLAIGTDEGGKIPVRDQFGNLRGFRKDKSGTEIVTKTKGTVLKMLAEKGKGSFYHDTFGSNVLEQLKKDLKDLEQTTFDTAEMVNYEELFQIFLSLALFFVIIEFLLSNRKAKSRVWKGRLEKGNAG